VSTFLERIYYDYDVTFGVEELIVVQTEDATLIMRRGQSQKVRDVLNT
jgi:hypothetical protein